MNNDKEHLYELLSLIMSSSKIGSDNYYDFMMMSNEKLMGYSVSLVMEIDDLLDEGYSKEEIAKLISNCNFTENDPELTIEEAAYLRKYAFKLLNIRYKLYMEDKNNKKVKKHLF